MEEPFRTQQIVGEPYFTDRGSELERVLGAMRTGGRLAVYGERRMGKSSLIARAAERIRSDGGVVISADAWAARSLDDVNRALFKDLPASWLMGDRVRRLLQTLRSLAVLSVDDSGLPTLRLSGEGGEAEPRERLERILRGLDEIAEGHEGPVVVVIDEFQKLEEIDRASVGLLRSLVQETPHVAYVFSGSIVGLVEGLLGPSGPFHAIDRMEIGPIDPVHLSTWMEDRMRSHGVRLTPGAVERIHELAGPVTEYVIRLAKVVYRRGSGVGEADEETVRSAFAEIVSDFSGSFELIWDKLSGSKRQIMRAVADGEQQLTAKAVLDRYDLASSATASYGINELRHDGLLAPSRPFRISDPFLTAWVRRQD